MSKVTFQLTVNGTPPPQDSFAVTFGENGFPICSAPCAGAGRIYTKTMDWPKNADATRFTFGRYTAPDGAFPQETFGQQTVTFAQDRTVAATFTYGAAGTGTSAAVTDISTPATGGAPPLAPAAVLTMVGTAALLLGVRRRSQRARVPTA